MARTPLALPIFLAVLLLSGCAGTQHTAAPPPHAVTGIVRGPLGDPVVGPVHHLVYGLGNGGVSVLDEATGRIRTLARFGRRHYPALLAVDSGAERVLVEDVRLDRVVGPKGRQDGVFTTLADDVDARTGRLISSIRMDTFTLYGYVEEQGSVAIDESLQRGFVTDHASGGVITDMRSGKVMARFRPGMADTENAVVSPVDPIAVDGRSHRLFLVTAGAQTRVPSISMVVIDTRTGRVLRRLALGLVYTKAFFFDAVNRRIVILGPAQVDIVDASHGGRLRTARPATFIDVLGIDSRLHRIFLFGESLGPDSARYLMWLDEFSGKAHTVLRYSRPTNGGYAPATGAIDPSAGRIFVLPEDGTITVFSTTGHLLDRIPLVPEARPLQTLWGMAVDEGTHRLILGGTRGALLVDTHAPYTH